MEKLYVMKKVLGFLFDGSIMSSKMNDSFSSIAFEELQELKKLQEIN